MNKISIIVPCYNEEEVLTRFYQETHAAVSAIPDTSYEFLFIDDGSRDHTLDILKLLCYQDSNCRYFSFSRNFGKEAAMYAGLKHACGDYCVIMDADLQHPPKLLAPMYHALSQEGYDCCAGKRMGREGDGVMRSFLSRSFYSVIQKLTHMNMSDGDFRMMNRTMVDAILQIQEYNRYTKGIFSFVGFETKWLEFENVERIAGQTKWSFWKLFKYSIEGIVAFTTTPLTLASFMGFFMCMLALCSTVFIVVRKLLFGDPVSGWASTASIITFIGGIQLFFMGIFGQYLAKAYTEIKNRPIYIIAESNLETEK